MISRISIPALFTALCLLGVLAVAFAAVTLAMTLSNGNAPWAPIEACCGGAVASFSLGWTLLMAIGMISAFAIVRAAFSVAEVARASRRIGNLRRIATLDRIAGHECLVIEDGRPLAFCGGLLRPRIFISRATINLLSGSELNAVVAHEEHHRRRFDPLRHSVMKVMSDSLFFLPMLSDIGQKCIERSEIAADRAAAAFPGGRKALAGALLALHANGDGGERLSVSTERIEGLGGRRPSWAPSRAASLATLAALGTLLAGTVAAVELVTRIPVGVEALGLHFCLAAMIVTPLLLTAGFAWTRPSVRI